MYTESPSQRPPPSETVQSVRRSTEAPLLRSKSAQAEPIIRAARFRVSLMSSVDDYSARPLAGLRVLMLVENLSLPYDRRVWLECLALRHAGCEVSAICPLALDRDDVLDETIEGVEIHRYRLPSGSGSASGYLKEYATALWHTWRIARRLARRQRFDVVHAANPPDILLFAALSLRRRGASLVFDHHDLVPELYALRFGGPHGLLYRIALLFERLSFRLADVVISTNASYRAIAMGRGKTKGENVFIVRNGPDAARRQALEPDLALKRGRDYLISYVGLMAPQDGVDHALRALALLKKTRTDWFAVFAGNGEAFDGLQHLVADLGLEDDVEFTGWLEPEQVIRLLSTSDVCLAPEPKNPLNDASTMIKIVEYMGLGRPIVSYDLTESRYSAGDAAVYAEANNVESFSNLIGELLEDPERRGELGRAGKQRAETSLSWERSEEQLLGAYLRLLALRRDRRATEVGDLLEGTLPTTQNVWRQVVSTEPVLNAGFECSHPFELFDYFRVPCRVDESVFGDIAQPQDGEVALGCLRWSKDAPGPALFWVRQTPHPARSRAFMEGHFFLNGIPIHGAVLTDNAMRAHADALGGVWTAFASISDQHGNEVGSARRRSDGSILLPFDPSELIHNVRSERYRSLGHASVARSAQRLATAAYYLARPLIARPLQIRLRRGFSRFQQGRKFPRWPVETALHDLYGWLFEIVGALAPEPVPWLAPWPRGHSWALVLTHDVETQTGYENIDSLCELESSRGYRSSWNLVPERYSVDDTLVERLLDDGFEVGVHGLYHDGRDLEAWFLSKRLPAMRTYATRWRATGFRSPATRRTWERMPTLGFDYDSSYPDTDPFEPDPGGCCSWLPFFNHDLMELPITLPQDHTLFVILRHPNESAWVDKTNYLREHEGMALIVTHPDYMLTEDRRAAYTRFLERYADDETAWRALPREVSSWWRQRAASSILRNAAGWYVTGPAAERGQIRFTGAERDTSGGPAEREVAALES